MGNSATNRVGDKSIFADVFDPRLIAFLAPPGALFLLLGRNSGKPFALLQKQDIGKTTNWEEITTNGGGGAGANGDLVYTFNDTNSPYVSASTPAFVVMAEIIFLGSGAWGVPTKFEIVAGSKTAGKEVEFKLFDQTNGKELALLTVDSAERVIFDMGVLTDIPVGAAVIEVQGRRLDGGAEAQISNLLMEF